ncbi:MAG: hypothetical protein IKJ63_05565 [Clostridia bacterium]|nr:hypothetical protein [Clostridia bacterium]MBR2413108.1 hypothetical protein [Clostridia bacterium]MBR3954919.1 hypothetical protein [Clostridia bacterium]
MADREAFLTNKIFLNAALPLLKVIAADVPNINKMFKNVHCVYQVSCLAPEAPGGKYAIHFVVNGDEWKIHPKIEPRPMVELEFKSVEALNAFFKGKIGPATLPKMKGVTKHPAAFAAFMAALLKMANLLGLETPPEDEDTKRLLVKCYFYLLSAGISQLNKNGHEEVHEWALKSPDRVYAFAVQGEPTVSAFIRVKAGKSRSGKGEYKRAMPFFTLKFRDLDAALGTLMSIDDMLEATKAGKIIMEGAPEFGAQIGGYMLLVGSLAK